MKKCSKCRIEKEPINFTKSRIRKDGLDVYCKECRNFYNRDKYSPKRNPTKNWIKLRCLICKKIFRCRPCFYKRGNAKYCSLTCLNKNNKKTYYEKRIEKIKNNQDDKPHK